MGIFFAVFFNAPNLAQGLLYGAHLILLFAQTRYENVSHFRNSHANNLRKITTKIKQVRNHGDNPL